MQKGNELLSMDVRSPRKPISPRNKSNLSMPQIKEQAEKYIREFKTWDLTNRTILNDLQWSYPTYSLVVKKYEECPSSKEIEYATEPISEVKDEISNKLSILTSIIQIIETKRDIPSENQTTTPLDIPSSISSKKEAEDYLKEFTVEEEQETKADDGEYLIEKPFNPREINIKSKTMSLDNIIKRLKESEIDMAPDFQRKSNLWTPEKQSRLIESMLIKLPLPAFYFDGTEDDQWLVVDGLQRLSAIKNFVVDGSLRLQGMEFLENINGKTFSELPRNYRRMIEETEIVAYIINPGTPTDVKFNIFKRINTGGLVLEPQEIRHALNQGKPAVFVAELANLHSFKNATENVIKTDRMLDREFTTRFLSFYLNGPDGYRPDLDTFMSNTMGQIRAISEPELEEIKNKFDNAMKLAKSIFGRWAFRKVNSTSERRKPINKALFEVWSVTLAKLTSAQSEALESRKQLLFEKFIHLMNADTTFIASITSATGDRTRVNYRYKQIQELVNSTLETTFD